MPNSLFDSGPDHAPWDLKTLIGNYNKGFKGSIYDPVHYNKFMSELPMPLFGAAAGAIKDSGKGKLSLPFKSVLFFDKGSYTERQTTGDCVSMGTRNAVDVTRAVQIHIHHSAEGWVTRGATEAIYGSRHHGGQGMACSQAAEFVHKTGGIILRQKYPSADLTVYNSSIGSRWGTAGVPHDIIEVGKQHQIKTVSLVKTIDEVRDALANGYGVACCSNQGFSSVRDKNGYSRPQGSWSHCMCICGCDDTHSIYNETTFCIVNSWGPNWISGPKPEFGIPDGAFMVRAETIARMVGGGGTFAYSQAIGFPPVKLPDYSNKSFL